MSKSTIKTLKATLNVDDPIQKEVYDFVKGNTKNVSNFLQQIIRYYMERNTSPTISPPPPSPITEESIEEEIVITDVDCLNGIM